jgi:hypothetical protein
MPFALLVAAALLAAPPSSVEVDPAADAAEP